MSEALSLRMPDSLNHAIHDFLKKAEASKVSLATAESCTGGMIASLFTDVEGYSHVFDSGFVVYSNEAKIRMLGVSASLLEEKGAVSPEVALAMAEGALECSVADLSLATTGFAGPGGPDSEEGLVHIACARRNGLSRNREMHYGSQGRGKIRLACVQTALEMMTEMLDESPR